VRRSASSPANCTKRRAVSCLPQQILENLGWTVHRIWSTDWYRNRAETIERLLRAVEEAKSAPRPAIAIEATPSAFVAEAYEEEQVAPPVDDLPHYEPCRTLRIPIAGELHQLSPEALLMAVEDVVAAEGPVHIDEVVRRIRTLWGLQRAGNRIRDAIVGAVDLATRRQLVTRDGDFLAVPNASVRVRRRNGDPPARIDLIAGSEIAEALRHVLRTQFATPREELIDAVARRFGIQATGATVAARIGGTLDAELARGALHCNGEMIRVAEPGGA
jgi:hypothetical protein